LQVSWSFSLCEVSSLSLPPASFQVKGDEALLRYEHRSRGRIAVRKLAHLRRLVISDDYFPITREYRVFLYCDQVLAWGFYWDEYTDDHPLSPIEQSELSDLATKAARRLQVPFIIVDIGQLDNGRWIVIEAGDAQFAGLGRIPVLTLWGKLKDIRLERQ
ncbi:MAG: ATP-grasp domain-containing protein, partial [Anaerolineae bacterium]|nr:ATP-grasp domain-containing protein [Anaerolineae bacterium]